MSIQDKPQSLKRKFQRDILEIVKLAKTASANEETSSNNEVMEQILNHMAAMREEMKDLKKEVIHLREAMMLNAQVENPQMASALSEISDDSFYDYKSKLPLASIEDLDSLEKIISQDNNKASSLAHFLYRGDAFHNQNALVLLIMKRLLKREVALRFSMDGKKGKRKFCDLNLVNVVVASVKARYGNADVAEIGKRIGRVLAGAIDWDGHRSKRQKKQIKLVDSYSLHLLKAESSCSS